MSLWKVGGALHPPERHTLTLIKTHTAQGEGDVLFGFFVHRYLPKPRIEIKR